MSVAYFTLHYYTLLYFYFSVCMLLSYTSQIDISQDKEPKKVVLVTNGRGYHQMLYTLINEV